MVENIPGPKGDTGAAGADGTDGVSSFTELTAPFTMPAEGAGVTVDVGNSEWMTVGQIVFAGLLASAAKGSFQVVSKPDGVSAILENLANAAAGDYTDNSAPGTVFPSTTQIGPGGQQGAAGTAGSSGAPVGATYITQIPNAILTNEQALSTLATGLMKSTTATGIVSIVVQGIANTNAAPVDQVAGMSAGQLVVATAVGIKSDTAANNRTALGLGTMAVQDANAVAVTGGNIGGITDLAIADGGTGASTASAAQDSLGKLLPRYGLIGSLTAVDLNSATTDNAITMRSSRYRLDKVTVENGSISLTTATAGVFTAAGGGGTTLAADQALSALTATTKFKDLTLQAIAGTDLMTAGTLYFRVGTAQGAAATANVWLWGWRFD